jgi:hypothetical protein
MARTNIAETAGDMWGSSILAKTKCRLSTIRSAITRKNPLLDNICFSTPDPSHPADPRVMKFPPLMVRLIQPTTSQIDAEQVTVDADGWLLYKILLTSGICLR